MIAPANKAAVPKIRAPIAILGVPFDNVTGPEAIESVERMVTSGEPHYLVTANVDFLVQARRDIELRRILFDAHLVLCDGTPLVWASRILGNGLPERVAGADLVPLLIRVAAEKGYRLFFLGAAQDSIERAVAKLERKYPSLKIAGFYSPPFNKLLEMDHEEIVRRIKAARPDMLFVSFGCPKQEKWIAMHYRSLGVPVTAGVGATIDFLAGRVKRAPVWMQRTGTEWVYRLLQEPRRLFRRYMKDLWVFCWSFGPQCWHLRAWRRSRISRLSGNGQPTTSLMAVDCEPGPSSFVVGREQEVLLVRPPSRLDHAAICRHPQLVDQIVAENSDCLLLGKEVGFVDSTGVGQLIRLQKKLRGVGRFLVLVDASRALRRALSLMQVEDFFNFGADIPGGKALLESRRAEQAPLAPSAPAGGPFLWQGEITAANAAQVWNCTFDHLSAISSSNWIIDLSKVRFIDSSGLGLMVRARKLARQNGRPLAFTGLQPPVRNVLRMAQLEEFLLRDPS